MACTRLTDRCARGYVFHNGGARVMGSAQALPERIDKDTAERVAGRHFCSTDFDALATQTPGFISREQLLEAARVRNLSFTLREKSQKKFDFGFVAEEKEGRWRVRRVSLSSTRKKRQQLRLSARPLGQQERERALVVVH